MSLANIGRAVFELRKVRDITQESLADALGVSGQAVSKWESGGAPDVDLLPAIADYFGVSIDHLYGRKAGAAGRVETELSRMVAEAPRDEAFAKAFELCWAIEKGLAGVTDNEITPDGVAEKHSRSHSQVRWDSGLTTMAFDAELRYFLIMPEPAEGWHRGLPDMDRYAELFAFLGERDNLRTLYLAYGRNSKPFTPRLIEKALSVDEGRAATILAGFLARGLVTTSTIELDDETKTVYTFTNNPAFVAVLALCTELLDPPTGFYCYHGGRNKPYLLARPE